MTVEETASGSAERAPARLRPCVAHPSGSPSRPCWAVPISDRAGSGSHRQFGPSRWRPPPGGRCRLRAGSAVGPVRRGRALHGRRHVCGVRAGAWHRPPARDGPRCYSGSGSETGRIGDPGLGVLDRRAAARYSPRRRPSSTTTSPTRSTSEPGRSSPGEPVQLAGMPRHLDAGASQGRRGEDPRHGMVPARLRRVRLRALGRQHDPVLARRAVARPSHQPFRRGPQPPMGHGRQRPRRQPPRGLRISVGRPDRTSPMMVGPDRHRRTLPQTRTCGWSTTVSDGEIKV